MPRRDEATAHRKRLNGLAWCLGLCACLTLSARLSLAAEQRAPTEPESPTLNRALPAPDARRDARLTEKLTVEVRTASLGSLTDQLSGALELRMSADPATSEQRLTLRAEQASVFSIQAALASLTRGRWQRRGDGATSTYVLHADTGLPAELDSLRKERRGLFVRRLLSLADSLGKKRPEVIAGELRAEVAARAPYLPEESLQQITPDYVRMALLALPLRLGIQRVLLEHGSAWVPLDRLPAAHQELLARFYAANRPSPKTEAGAGTTAIAANPAVPAPGGIVAYSAEEVLGAPQARVEYRFVYGDRWTGSLLSIRVGAGDHWATVNLPAALFDLPDYSTLFTAAAQRPTELEHQEDLKLLIETDTQTWDQALLALAKAAKINVVSDSYLRPPAFRPAGRGPVLAATTLRETLDAVCDYYGYVWWRQGDFYVFRNRNWAEEERVAIPDSLTRALGLEATANGRLSAAGLGALATLTDEQLLTLHLFGSAAGQVFAPEAAFDFNEVQLVRNGLLLFAQLEGEAAELARTRGIIVAQTPPTAQFLFASSGDDRGIPFDTEEMGLWRFRITPEIRQQRLPGGLAQVGSLRFAFDYGPAGVRTTGLALRLPHVEPPARPAETEAPKPAP